MSTTPRPSDRGKQHLTKWRASHVELALGCIAIAAGGLLMNAVREHLPSHLNVSTGIIGYNTFHAFDASAYLSSFYLLTVGWIITSGVVFLVLRFSTSSLFPWPSRGPLLPAGRRSPTAGVEPGGPNTPGVDRRSVLVGELTAVLRVVAVGAVFGFLYAFGWHVPSSAVIRDVAGVCVVYTLGVVLFGFLAVRARVTPRLVSAVAGTNALGACTTVTGLALVSERTTVTTLSDGGQHAFPWLPLWLALAVTALLVLVVTRLMWRRQVPVGRIDYRALFLIAVPVLIYLLTARIPGQMSPLDYSAFEIGQRIAPVRFMQMGQFPWRDWVSIHGLFVDGLSESFGYYTIQASEWGAAAGQTLVLVPAAYLAIYYFAYRVVGASWALLASLTLVFLHPVFAFDLRFMGVPLIMLLLAASLDRGGWLRPVALGFAMLAYAVIVPEAAVVVVACAVAAVARDAYRADWRRGHRTRSFHTTTYIASGGLAAAVLLFAILAWTGAIGSFLSYYATFVPSHDLTGATPLLPMVMPYAFWVIAPAAGVLLGALLLFVKIWRRVTLGTLDFVMVAGMITALLYYQKFTARADYHIIGVFGLCVPLFVVVTWELVRALDSLLRRDVALRRLRPTAAVVLTAVTVLSVAKLHALPALAATQFHATVAAEPWSSQIGYAVKDDQPKYTDMQTFLQAYLRPGDEIFDMSNEPGLLYYQLPYRPAGRYYLVADAILPSIQENLVSELTAHMPTFVVFQDSTIGALSTWDDVSNPVRHYDVSQFILDHYRPFADVHGALIYVKESVTTLADPTSLSARLSQPVTTSDIPFMALPCDWGFAPTYLNIDHPPDTSATTLLIQQLSPRTLSLDLGTGKRWSAYHWIEITMSGAVNENHFQLHDTGVGGENRSVMFSLLAGGPSTYRFPIGACAQWHGYGSGTLILSSSARTQIANIQLLP